MRSSSPKANAASSRASFSRASTAPRPHPRSKGLGRAHSPPGARGSGRHSCDTRPRRGSRAGRGARTSRNAMTKRWRIHEETLAEIDATVTWYEEQRAGLGLEFLGELRTTLGELREAPTASTREPAFPDTGVRRRRVHRFPYA